MTGHSLAAGAAACARAARCPYRIPSDRENVPDAKARVHLERVLEAQTTQYAMGTVMTHRAFGLFAEDSLAAVCQEVARLEALLSRFLPDSEISRLNASAGAGSVTVSRETCEVLSTAVEFSRGGAGCFDVTVGPLIPLWRAARESLSQPDAWRIRQALALVDYRDLILDPLKATAGLRHVGQSVDLGGIGKGYAGDRVVDVFKRFGISSAYSNLGGNVVTLGARPDGNPWQIGIQHPRRQDRLIGAVSVVDQTVVTSGDYQRTYTDRHGKRHHHILNPTTGYPADSGLISATVVTNRSVAADPLSTMLFVAGMQKGLELLRSFPQTEAIFVDIDMRVYVTHGLRTRFRADNDIEATILD